MFAPQTLGSSLPASPAVFKVNLFVKSLVIAPTLSSLYQKKIKGNKFPRSSAILIMENEVFETLIQRGFNNCLQICKSLKASGFVP